jgi:hypothetical protein
MILAVQTAKRENSLKTPREVQFPGRIIFHSKTIIVDEAIT